MATDKLKQIKSVCNIARSELKKRPFDSKRDQARTLAFINDIDRILATLDRRAVKKYYGYSSDKAIQALRILTPKQLDYIKDKLNKGGKKL